MRVPCLMYGHSLTEDAKVLLEHGTVGLHWQEQGSTSCATTHRKGSAGPFCSLVLPLGLCMGWSEGGQVLSLPHVGIGHLFCSWSILLCCVHHGDSSRDGWHKEQVPGRWSQAQSRSIYLLLFMFSYDEEFMAELIGCTWEVARGTDIAANLCYDKGICNVAQLHSGKNPVSTVLEEISFGYLFYSLQMLWDLPWSVN